MSLLLGDNLINKKGFNIVIGSYTQQYPQLISRTISSFYETTASLIRTGAFYNCTKLTGIYCPQATIIRSSAFQFCTKLQSVIGINVITIEEQAFYSCYSLNIISFPRLQIIGSSAFYNCSSLTSLKLLNITRFHSYAFSSCKNFITLDLTNVSAIPVLDLSVFHSTPIGGYSNVAGQYGSVYVPASLYSSFLTATNWSDISERIVSV